MILLRREMPTERMEAIIATELHVGDSVEDIEKFIARHEIPCNWEPQTLGYYCRLREPNSHRSVYIRIKIDNENRIKEIYIHDGLPRL